MTRDALISVAIVHALPSVSAGLHKELIYESNVIDMLRDLLWFYCAEPARLSIS